MGRHGLSFGVDRRRERRGVRSEALRDLGRDGLKELGVGFHERGQEVMGVALAGRVPGRARPWGSWYSSLVPPSLFRSPRRTLPRLPRAPFAVVAPTTDVALSGAIGAGKAGLIEPILVGSEAVVRGLASKLGIDLTGIRVVDAHDEPTPRAKRSRSAATALPAGS